MFNIPLSNIIKKIAFCILVIILPSTLFAQTLTGLVTDMSDKGPISNVVIRNKNSNQIVYSDEQGKFHILAQKGDSLLFYSQGYFPTQIMMRDNKDLFRQISMRRKAITLKEITIAPGWTAYQLDSIDRRETYGSALDQRKTTSVFSPFSMLADNISKKAKQRWRFQKNYAKWEHQKFMDTRYSPEEVHELTGLSDDTLAAFINAYPMPYDYARTASDLEIKMWIKYNYRVWKKHPYVPDLPEVDFTDSLHGFSN